MLKIPQAERMLSFLGTLAAFVSITKEDVANSQCCNEGDEKDFFRYNSAKIGQVVSLFFISRQRPATILHLVSRNKKFH